MSEVILFNHIPKTAGSTMKHVLWRVVGGDRVLFSGTIGQHRERIATIAAQLDRPLDAPYAVMAHTGFGVEEQLPDRHDYPKFTTLRDPTQRTISEFFYARDDRGNLPADMTLDEFLSGELLRSYNSQTAFLAGLSTRHHLDGLPLERGQFDRDLLEQAKRNLEAHDAVGLTERFDESLLLLRRSFGWSLPKTLYRSANVGASRHTAPRLSPRDFDAIAASNELDLELYAFARELFEVRLAEQLPDSGRRLRRFRRLNGAYGRAYPVAYPPARALARSTRRLRGAAASARGGLEDQDRTHGL